MSKQVIVGFSTEGSTDVRFWESVIQRSFESVAFECEGQIEILPIQYIPKQSGSFVDMVQACARKAEEYGVMILCIHSDADAPEDRSTFEYKITPAFAGVENISGNGICKNLVAIVPVQMTEAWMLSDKELLKSEIGTVKSDIELGIDREPETYSDPKQAIESAIRVAREDLTKRRRRELTIAELYLPIGQKLVLSRLENLSSYLKFKEAIRQAFRNLNYLY